MDELTNKFQKITQEVYSNVSESDVEFEEVK